MKYLTWDTAQLKPETHRLHAYHTLFEASQIIHTEAPLHNSGWQMNLADCLLLTQRLCKRLKWQAFENFLQNAKLIPNAWWAALSTYADHALPSAWDGMAEGDDYIRCRQSKSGLTLSLSDIWPRTLSISHVHTIGSPWNCLSEAQSLLRNLDWWLATGSRSSTTAYQAGKMYGKDGKLHQCCQE